MAAPDLSPFAQLGLGALVASFPAIVCRVLWEERKAERKEFAALQADQIARERGLNDKTVPVLAECVRVLTAVAKATEEETMARRVEEKVRERGQR